jgi:hypothetical protein
VKLCQYPLQPGVYAKKAPTLIGLGPFS